MAWRLIHSRKIEKDVAKLCIRAQSEGRLETVATVMDRVMRQLEVDPLAIGEPNNRLKHLDLLLCVVVDLPMVVRYAVDEKRNWVYIRSVELLS